MDVAAAEPDLCRELMMSRTWSSSSGSESDGTAGPRQAGMRRRSPSSSRSDGSEMSEPSEPGSDLDDVLNHFAKFYPNEKTVAPKEVQHELRVEDFGELPVIDDDMLGFLPGLPVHTPGSTEAVQPVLATPVQQDEWPTAAAAGRSDSDSADDNLGPTGKLDKRQRNRAAAAKCRRNKRIREAKVRDELEQLQKKVCTLQNEKKQMASQLEQFRRYFSQQNLSSALLSGLCVICAVICVVAPHSMATSAAPLPGNQPFASPTARSLLSVSMPPQDMADPLGFQAHMGSVSATELLLSCLSTVHPTVLQEAA